MIIPPIYFANADLKNPTEYRNIIHKIPQTGPPKNPAKVIKKNVININIDKKILNRLPSPMIPTKNVAVSSIKVNKVSSVIF
jgi:hypothetical protein